MQDLRLEDNDRLLRLRVESEEDLWALYALIRPGDLVVSRTSRELRGEGGSRRKAMTLGVRVKDVEYQPFTSRLRVRGVIEVAPKELDLEGQHHTLAIEPGMEVAVRREGRWRKEDLEELRRLSGGLSARALVAAIDDEEYAVALVSGGGVQVIEEGEIGLPGKDAPDAREAAWRRAIAKVAEVVRRAASEHGIRHVVVVGPAHWKDDLASELGDLGARVIVDSASYGGIKGVYEALRRDSMKEVLRDAILREELELMDRINALAARDPDLLAYSLEGVEDAVSRGAAQEVVVDSDALRSPDPEVSARALRILEGARRTGAAAVILESRHPELRAWISGLGGAVAVLRYRPPRNAR